MTKKITGLSDYFGGGITVLPDAHPWLKKLLADFDGDTWTEQLREDREDWQGRSGYIRLNLVYPAFLHRWFQESCFRKLLYPEDLLELFFENSNVGLGDIPYVGHLKDSVGCDPEMVGDFHYVERSDFWGVDERGEGSECYLVSQELWGKFESYCLSQGKNPADEIKCFMKASLGATPSVNDPWLETNEKPVSGYDIIPHKELTPRYEGWAFES